MSSDATHTRPAARSWLPASAPLTQPCRLIAANVKKYSSRASTSAVYARANATRASAPRKHELKPVSSASERSQRRTRRCAAGVSMRGMVTLSAHPACREPPDALHPGALKLSDARLLLIHGDYAWQRRCIKRRNDDSRKRLRDVSRQRHGHRIRPGIQPGDVPSPAVTGDSGATGARRGRREERRVG